jgi:UDP-2-acetamido-3-amino-2,3-dideoxy-glucuronate N-acetyltransferase
VQIHPSALCETEHVGSGTRVWAFAHLLPGARVGADCNICDHVFIEGGAILGDRVTVKNASLIWDGVTIEDDVFIGPRVTFTNDLRPRIGFPVPADGFVPTVVRRGATLGANVTVVCGTTVGQYAMVGAGAVVSHDVPPHAIVAGVPARTIGWACVCGRSLDTDRACTCGRRFSTAPAGGLEEITDTGRS